MSYVELDTTWLHLLSDPAQQVFFPATRSRENEKRGGEVKVYTGSNRRSISTDVHSRMITLNAFIMDRDEYNTLRAWLRKPVMLRDPAGRIVYGVAYEVTSDDESWTAKNRVRDVQIAITEITYEYGKPV